MPWLLPIASVPDTVFLNQLACVVAWALWIELGAGNLTGPAAGDRAAVAAGLVPLIALALLAARTGQTGTSLVLACAAVVMWAAQRVASRVHVPVTYAFWLAGLGSSFVAAAQYFAPSLTDNVLLAASTAAGRAVGNMRQPNHLATALLCAIVWTAWLWQAGRLRTRLAAGSIGFMVLGIAMSASRTGALALGALLVWALLDRSLPRAGRWLLGLSPLVYLVCWVALAGYAALEQVHFYGAERLETQGDISSSRFAIWRDALVLIAQNPWTGVGWANFNFAWTFTRFPDRPQAFFDHTHNLPLQLAVEIGVPATLVLLVLLGGSLWRGRVWLALGAGEGAPDAPLRRASLAMLLVLLLHSCLEYPLWYPYFLLPAAWALGVYLSGPTPAPDQGVSTGTWPQTALRLAGVAMIAGTCYAWWDHRRVEVIFSPPKLAAPLKVRIAEGRKSRLFGHHADYAAVTTEPAAQPLAAFRRPLHQLVDTRLLIAYAEALHAKGRDAEALYVAQRLREFRRPDAQAFFKDCEDSETPLFQCSTEPVQGLTWRDLDPP